MRKIKKDIAIVGAGPVGLFAVFEAGMLNMSSVVIDTLDFIGGQCVALYPQKPIYDIPGFPEIMAQDLINNLARQAQAFTPEYLLGNQVVSFSKQGDNILLNTSMGYIIEAKVMIIAAGCGAFGPNKPPLDGIEQYEGKSVHYYISNKESFRDKMVAIAGGGDSAIDWALELAHIAKKVYVIHRRDKFRAAPNSIEKMHLLAQEGVIDIVTSYQLHSIYGKNGKMQKLTIATLDGELKDLEVDALLPFYGLSMKLGPIAEWGLNLDKNHIAIPDSTTMETNIERIFAIGDIATYPNKQKLILSGFAEAASACYKAYQYVYPDRALHFEYSTTKGIPQ